MDEYLPLELLIEIGKLSLSVHYKLNFVSRRYSSYYLDINNRNVIENYYTLKVDSYIDVRGNVFVYIKGKKYKSINGVIDKSLLSLEDKYFSCRKAYIDFINHAHDCIVGSDVDKQYFNDKDTEILICEEYFLNGVYHNRKLPSMNNKNHHVVQPNYFDAQHFKDKRNKAAEWYIHGNLQNIIFNHYPDGVTIIEHPSGKKEYTIDGILHRENGPAIEDVDGNNKYYINGKEFTKEDYYQIYPIIIYNIDIII